MDEAFIKRSQSQPNGGRWGFVHLKGQAKRLILDFCLTGEPVLRSTIREYLRQ